MDKYTKENAVFLGNASIKGPSSLLIRGVNRILNKRWMRGAGRHQASVSFLCSCSMALLSFQPLSAQASWKVADDPSWQGRLIYGASIEWEGLSPTLEPIPVPVIPANVTTVAQAVSSAGKTLSLIGGSVCSVTQASRADAVFKVLSCYEQGADLPQPAVMDHPLRFPVGHGDLEYFNGMQIGNMAIIGVSTLAALAAGYRWSFEKAKFPGIISLPVAFFATPLATAVSYGLRLGLAGEKALAGITMISQVAPVLTAVGHLVGWFGAKYIEEDNSAAGTVVRFFSNSGDWVDLSSVDDVLVQKDYVRRYGLLFRDFRRGFHGTALLELGLSYADGVLASMQDNCDSALYVATALHAVHAIGIIALRPHRDPVEKVYAIATSSLLALSLILATAQRASPEFKNNTALSLAAQSIPTALMFASLAKGAYDIGSFGWETYKKNSGLKAMNTVVHELGTPMLVMPEAGDNGLSLFSGGDSNDATVGTFIAMGRKSSLSDIDLSSMPVVTAAGEKSPIDLSKQTVGSQFQLAELKPIDDNQFQQKMSTFLDMLAVRDVMKASGKDENYCYDTGL